MQEFDGDRLFESVGVERESSTKFARFDAEISADRNRVAARLGLRQRKTDEAYQQWLLQLRDTAYVEYRLEEQ